MHPSKFHSRRFHSNTSAALISFRALQQCRDDDDAAFHCALPVDRYLKELEHVADAPKHEYADECADDWARPAAHARAADDDSGDDIQFIKHTGARTAHGIE